MQMSKKNWITTTFGEIAIQQKTDIDRESSVVDRYVAGEHMNSEDLHIRQWGVFCGQYLGPAFRRKFEKGDILYGSRRTYLKKVAVANFDGITANTTFVIKPNKEKIYPALLPFLMLSDSFTEHSIKHSKGSVNPYINWKDIANYEFKLPSLVDDQKRIADLLWSVDECRERQILAYDKLILLLRSFVRNIFKSSKESIALKKIVISDRLDVEKAQEGEMPYIEIGDIDISNKSINLKDKAAVSGSKYAKFRDIIISKVRPTRGAITMVNLEKVAISNAFTIVRANEGFDQELLFVLLAYNNHFLNYLGERSTGSTYPAVADEDVFSYKIPSIGKGNQEKMLSRFVIFKKSIDLFKNNIEKINKIQKQIINQIFG